MVVLGIDPGLANTGYGVVADRAGRMVALDGGVIETSASLATERRLALIAARGRELLEEHGCGAVAFEDLYFGQNIVSAFAVGHARGVLMLLAGERGIPCFSYTPQQVKAAVCGHGRAPKDQVARMVACLLSLPRAAHARPRLGRARGGAVPQQLLTASQRARRHGGRAMIALLRGEVVTRAPSTWWCCAAASVTALAVSARDAPARAGGRAGGDAAHAPDRARRRAGAVRLCHARRSEICSCAALGVQAVGPKVALAVLSAGRRAELVGAIAAGDVRFFQAVRESASGPPSG